MTQGKIQIVIDADLEELIPDFLKNRSVDVTRLKEASDNSDFESIRSIGHSLKGVGGGYGFMKITELGAELEKSAKVNDMENIRTCISELENYLENIEIIYE